MPTPNLAVPAGPWVTADALGEMKPSLPRHVMKMNQFALAICAIALVGCTTVQKSVRVGTSLRAQEYNSVASRYMERPTFVSLEDMSDGRSVMMIQMETYAVPSTYSSLRLSPQAADALRNSQLRFVKEQVPGYIAAIDKFLEWAALAAQRKDAFTKEIGRVPTWSNMGTGHLQFSFHSGNDQAHFLVIAFSAAGTTLDEQAQYFDVPNARELKRLLLAFASDSLRRTDIGSVYK